MITLNHQTIFVSTITNQYTFTKMLPHQKKDEAGKGGDAGLNNPWKHPGCFILTNELSLQLLRVFRVVCIYDINVKNEILLKYLSDALDKENGAEEGSKPSDQHCNTWLVKVKVVGK